MGLQSTCTHVHERNDAAIGLQQNIYLASATLEEAIGSGLA
jgi:hypothetical protein